MKCSHAGGLFICALLVYSTVLLGGRSAGGERLSRIHLNDNRTAAGQLRDGVLTLTLRAGVGQWRPEGAGGPVLTVEAFGEVTGALQVPAPLVRVTEGTRIIASVRNDLAEPFASTDYVRATGRPVRRWMCRLRPLARFASSPHAPALTTTGRRAPERRCRSAADQIRSCRAAFIVDPAGATIADDRVIVLTEDQFDASLPEGPHERHRHRCGVPGDRSAADVPQQRCVLARDRAPHLQPGDRVHWRVVNLSSQFHPMHLHGFYSKSIRSVTVFATRRLPPNSASAWSPS